jgi:hypothetical protein
MATDIGRRKFISVLSGATVAWPLAAARARSTEELASRLSTLPRPGLLEAVIADRTWPGCSPLRRPSSSAGALRRTRERR